MNPLKQAWDRIVDVVEGEDSPQELTYDPVHVAGVVVGCLCVFGGLFWMLWSLLVFEGGILTKIAPAVQVLFTGKTLGDVGYEGYPHRMGIFDGWMVNLAALGFAAASVYGVWWLLRPKGKK